MFCKKCGNELKEDERFCGKCGTPVESSGSEQNQNRPNFSFSVSDLRNNLKVTTLYLFAAVLFVFEIILWFCGTINISVLGYSESVSISFLLSEANIGFLSVILVLMSILSSFLCVIPLFLDIIRYRKLILQKVVAILNLCLYFFVSMVALSEGSSAFSEVDYTFGGWMLILSGIGLVILLFFIPTQTKKLNS